MQVIGLCRFSYPGEGGFQVEHSSLQERIDYLYAPERMNARFAQFETITLPGLKAQTDPDFTFVIVIGDSLPTLWRERLDALIADFPQARVVAREPGRHRAVMQSVLNDARDDADAPCLQFRHDDDDAVAVDFVERLRAWARTEAETVAANRLVAFDFRRGYSALPTAQGIAARETILPMYGVALAMAVNGGTRQSIMNFAHKKLARFMPVLADESTPMFVRGHNDHNDSRQKSGIAPLQLEPLDYATRNIFRSRFAIDEDEVRRVFSAI